MTTPITKFTNKIPFWQPRITPLELGNATKEQLNAMRVTPSDTGIGEYVLVLAHDPQILDARTPLFNGIMYSHGGLSRQETELGAVAASVLNHCIYCAAVHANRYNQLTKTEKVMESIFGDNTDTGLDERQKAIFDFATNLSSTPSECSEANLLALANNGLSKDEILDLILVSSLFGWANRLIHVLGDPIEK